MKLNFNWNDDGRCHQYCVRCHAESVRRVYEDGKTYYFCDSCEQRAERSIVMDPAITWWIADDGEYWHESSGVFVRNPDNRFLFFERTIFPFSLTVPSGHVDSGEDPAAAASRELTEEVGLDDMQLEPIAHAAIVGDSCRRGSDAHQWHAYRARLDSSKDIEVKEEGGNPVWLTLEEACQRDLVFPVRYIIERYANELCAVGELSS